MEKVNTKNKNYEYVVPDGGWGYMIVVSFIITCSSVTMFMGCFGLLYNDFMIEIGMNSTEVTLLVGANALCFASGGFLTNSILKIMSLRKLCLLAVLIHDIGAISVVFVTSMPAFFLCQGVLMGSGLGISFNLSCTILNDYFAKRRMVSYSVGQFFVAVSSMVAPLFVKWSLQEFGFRGTVLLVAGVMLHNIFGAVLMQPVEMHMIRVEVLPIIPVPEKESLLKEEKTVIVKSSDEEKAEPEKKAKKSNDDIRKMSSIRRFVEAFVDIAFAKKFILSCTCIGPALCAFADNVFALIMPQALFALGWNQEKVALAISIYGFGDLATRTLFMFIGGWIVRIGTQEIYVIGIILACISRLGMLWSENQILIYLYISIMGVARCCILVLITMVLSEVVPSDKFTQAVGISMMVSGVTILVLGPAIGAIRDLTNSYNTAFYLLTSCFAIVALFWSIELCYKKNKQKRKIQKENLEKIKSCRLNKGK